MGNRLAATAFILKYIDKIAPGGENKKIYEDLFSKMSDTDFDKFMKDLLLSMELELDSQELHHDYLSIND